MTFTPLNWREPKICDELKTGGQFKRGLCWMLAIGLITMIQPPPAANGQDEAAQNIAQTASTAQNNSAYEFAAQQWEKLLSQFPESPLAGKAHYNAGICQLQTNEFRKAIDHFNSALPKLADDETVQKPQAFLYLGFAQFRLGQQLIKESKQDEANALLTTATQTFENLLKNSPKFEDADQACYFQGGAFEELNLLDKALASYTKMLDYQKQTFKLEGLYAVADLNDQLGQYKQAAEFYEKFRNEADANNPLLNEVNFRTGRTMINVALADEKQGDKTSAESKFKQAAKLLADVADQNPTGKDKQFLAIIEDARYQQAFCARRLGQFATAAALYENVASNPKSRFAAQSLAYAGRNYLDAGEIEKATTTLEKAVAIDSAFSNEAAHWLAGIYLNNKQPQKAFDLATARVKKSADDPMLVVLMMDQADAAYAIEDKRAESAKLFELIAEKHPEHMLAPSALYNAAFTSLELKDYQSAIEKVDRFESKYPGSEFLPDTLEVKADACLLSDKPDDAQRVFDQLVSKFPAHEKNLLWKLRSGLALYHQEKYRPTIEQLTPLISTMSEPSKKAETLHWIGSSQFQLKEYANAVNSLVGSISTDGKWKRADETLLTLCRAQLAMNNAANAKETAQRLMAEHPDSAFLSDLHYHLGEYDYDAKRFQDAFKHFNEINQNHGDSKFAPFALYNAAWSQLELEKFADSEKLFSVLIEKFPDHELAKRAKVGRGASRRKTGDVESSIADLRDFLKTNPEGKSRFNALYEIGLAQVELKKSKDAIGTFKQLISEAPDSPRLDRFYYELAWAHRSVGDEGPALEFFKKLTVEKPASPLAAESNFHVGTAAYNANQFDDAIKAYEICINSKAADHIREKAAYKLAWAHYKQNQFEQAHAGFTNQTKTFANGELFADGLFMAAESQFRLKNHTEAFQAYAAARPVVEQAEKIEPKIKWLTMLHGAQSGNKIKKYREAIELAKELDGSDADDSFKQDAALEMGTAYAGLKQFDEALVHYQKAAENPGRTGARARCMIGDIYFKDKQFQDAINEFKLVYFGFGGPQAADDVKPWQAYAIYEAARCSFIQVEDAPADQKSKLIAEAVKQFEYLLKNYGDDRLAPEAKKQLATLKKLEVN